VKNLMLSTVYQARSVIEMGAVPLALARIADEEVRQLRDLVEAARRSSKPAEIRDVDFQLHLRLVEASGNPLLVQMLLPLINAVSTDIRLVHGSEVLVEEFLAWHQEIVEAIEARDVARCQAAVEGHLARGLAVVTGDEPESAELQPAHLPADSSCQRAKRVNDTHVLID
jgi:DNA-binding FadR family transcriptional regulator